MFMLSHLKKYGFIQSGEKDNARLTVATRARKPESEQTKVGGEGGGAAASVLACCGWTSRPKTKTQVCVCAQQRAAP